jgi:hypothetical protein
MKDSMFIRKLKEMNISPLRYLQIMRYIAEKNGYNPRLLDFATNNTHKLNYNGVNFGSAMYKDYIIYLLTDTADTAEKRRSAYLKRALKIDGDWEDNDESPNSLAIYVIWDGSDVLRDSTT